MGYLRKIVSILFNRPAFRSRLKMLEGKEGVATEQLYCGCLLKGEHFPEKEQYVLTYDYSKCREKHMAFEEKTKSK